MMLAIIGALREELAGIRKRMDVSEVSLLENYPVCKGNYRGKNILLVQTGMGRERAEAATRLLLDSYPVSLLISLGFSGALSSELKVGDIVICSRLYGAHGDTSVKLPGTYYSDNAPVFLISQALKGAAIGFRHGASVTVARPVQLPEAKLALGKAFDAEVVDMESYWIAEIASGKHIPFIAIRAISDKAHDCLPPFDRILTSQGKLILKKAAAHFIARPDHMAVLPVLYWKAWRAGKKLDTVIHHLVTNYDAA